MYASYVRRLIHLPFGLLRRMCERLPHFRFVKETRGTQTPITFHDWFRQHILGVNHGPYWPVHPSSRVTGWRNIVAGVETSPGQSGGCYIQGLGKIFIGDYTQIAPNVGIISANHSLTDNRKHKESTVRIGEYCWIGMGAIILPGVTLGDFTVVGAGAVVTKSFPDGHCVLAGNPAKLLKTIDPKHCIRHQSDFEYCGYIRKEEFELFRRERLNA